MPKPMKVMKAELKKKPAASGLAGLKDKNKEGMSLEDKMELFRKRGTDIGSFLDSLTKHQREALWQRFSAARSALKDGEAEALWASVAKGKGSDPAKRKLLACFLKMGGDLKGKRDLWHKELLCYTKSSGNFPANKLFAAGPVKGFALPACYLPEVRGTQRNGSPSRKCPDWKTRSDGVPTFSKRCFAFVFASFRVSHGWRA